MSALLDVTSTYSSVSNGFGNGARKRKEVELTDRCIPVRVNCFGGLEERAVDMEREITSLGLSPRSEDHQRLLMKELGEDSGKGRVFNYQRQKIKVEKRFDAESLGLGMTKLEVYKKPQAKDYRKVASAPVRTLDAPGVVDDFYVNTLDWASDNTVAVALANELYVWDADEGKTSMIFETEDVDNYISSVKFHPSFSSTVAVGTNHMELNIVDVHEAKVLRTIKASTDRVGVLAWNGQILTSGARDSLILHHDLRIKDCTVAKLKGHDAEVCALAWNHNETMLASGSHDTTVCIYDHRMYKKEALEITTEGKAKRFTPLQRLQGHTGTTKALAWSPHFHGVLATGGGAGDTSIKLWNAVSGTQLSSTFTGAPVSSLVYNRFDDELLSSHGGDKNHLSLWEVSDSLISSNESNKLRRVKDLLGHQNRIICSAISPCGTTVGSLSGDESLRFWNVFAESQQKSKKIKVETPPMKRAYLR